MHIAHYTKSTMYIRTLHNYNTEHWCDCNIISPIKDSNLLLRCVGSYCTENTVFIFSLFPCLQCICNIELIALKHSEFELGTGKSSSDWMREKAFEVHVERALQLLFSLDKKKSNLILANSVKNGNHLSVMLATFQQNTILHAHVLFDSMHKYRQLIIGKNKKNDERRSRRKTVIGYLVLGRSHVYILATSIEHVVK